MKTFYCVTTTVFNDGRLTAVITDELKSDTIPEGTRRSTGRKDVYNDWFDSRKAAMLFVKASKEA